MTHQPKLSAALLAGLIALTTPSLAETLELERAVSIALEKHPMIAMAAAGVEGAEARLAEARAARLPSVELSETASRTNNPVMVFSGLLVQESFGPENFAIASLNQPDPLNNFNTRISLSQPLWTGGRIGAGVAAARAGEQAAQGDAESTRQQVVRGVVDAYTGAVLAKSALGVARDALKTAEAHVEMIRDLREAGLVVESDLLQARVRAGEIREMVVDAEAQHAVALAALNVAMGLDLSSAHVLPDALDRAELESAPLPQLEEEALASRPDLAAMLDRIEAARAMQRAARGARWPSVGLGGAYEANDESAPGTEGTNWSVMLAARWEVFDGGRTRARVAQAGAKLREAESARELLESRVGLEVRQAWHGLRAAASRIDTADAAVAMAEESLRVVEDRYRNGLATLVELLEAESALTRAKTRLVAAQRSALTARAALDLATGRL
jgi:outer membrane protein TolC